MSFPYVYTKSNCTPKKLTNEISINLGINPNYVTFERSSSIDNLVIYFDSALTAPEEAQLDIIVANHVGDNLEATFILGNLLVQDSLFSSGIATANTMSVNSFSAQTIYSGITNIYDLFTPSGFSRLDLQVITSGDTSRLTTTSTSFTGVPGMSATTKNFGTSATTYQIRFDCDVSNSTNNAQVIVRLIKNGVELSGTTRNVTMAAANQRLNMTTVGFATNVSGGDVFNAQWRVNAGTATMTGRTFSVLGTIINNVI